MQATLAVGVLAGVAEGREGVGGGEDYAVGIVGGRADDAAGAVGQGADAAELVGVVVERNGLVCYFNWPPISNLRIIFCLRELS